jgi:hypothetical protein
MEYWSDVVMEIIKILGNESPFQYSNTPTLQEFGYNHKPLNF